MSTMTIRPLRAKLRTDLRELIGENRALDVVDFAQDYAGKRLEVLNVVVGRVTVKLSRPYYTHYGDCISHITAFSVPHEWLETDVTKEEFHAWKKMTADTGACRCGNGECACGGSA